MMHIYFFYLFISPSPYSFRIHEQKDPSWSYPTFLPVKGVVFLATVAFTVVKATVE